MKNQIKIWDAILYPFFGGCIGFLSGGTAVFLIFITFYQYLGNKYLIFIFYSGMIGIFLGYIAGVLFIIKNKYSIYSFFGSILGLIVGILIVFEVPNLSSNQVLFVLVGFSIMGFALSYYIKLSINTILN